MTIPSDHSAPDSGPWRIDVVMPVYNEGYWPRRAVDAVSRSAARARVDVRVLVVDDGSDDRSSVEVLEALADRRDVIVHRQPNQGRFAARAAGLARVEAPYVLLLDARVEVHEDALPRLRDRVDEGGPLVWNFDVTAGGEGLGAAFWSGITKVWWRDYFRDRREVSFGQVEFDRYPKGTTAFFAPAAVLRQAMGDFGSWYADTTVASDDTRLLREVAGSHPISLSPLITCRHHNKTGARAWARQCYYRGTTFVDGYLRDPADAVPLLRAGVAASVLGLVAAAAVPKVTTAAALTACGAAAVLTMRSGGTAKESGAVGLLSIPFGVLFWAGAVRGLRMVHDIA